MQFFPDQPDREKHMQLLLKSISIGGIRIQVYKVIRLFIRSYPAIPCMFMVSMNSNLSLLEGKLI